MSFYTLGFIGAAVLYFVHLMKQGKQVTTLSVVIAILLGLLSWFGIIIILIVMSFKGRDD